MGFWERAWKRVKRVFAPKDDAPTGPPPGGDTYDSGGEYDAGSGSGGSNTFGDSADGGGLAGNSPDNPPGHDNPEFDFSIAGYLPMGGNARDDYVNTEGWSTIDLADFGDIDWPETDYVVVKIYEAGGASYYTTIVGPFSDYWDFLAHVENWWEEGS